MHEESEASWACDIQVFAFLNDLGFNYSLCSHVALSGSSCLHPVNELSGSTTQWKSCIWCIGWRAWSTCVKSLWLWSPPERMAAQSTALERSHRSSLVFFFFFFLSFYLHFSFFLSFLKKDFLCFNPCLSKRLFFLIWKPISFGLHRSCLWCDGSCWKSPKEYLCSQLEVEAELHTGARGGGWLGWQLLLLWRE